ncbi:MAG: hypothetical protein AABM42_01410 [Actinomycetota bacterium]
MDFTRLTQGEKIAGVSGIALILIMFIFDWFGLKADVSGFTAEGSRNAWGSYGFIDIVLFITVAAAIGLALISASQTEVGLPVAASAVVAGLGILSVVLIIISIISPPDFGADLSGSGIDNTRKIGVWLGLIAAIGVAYGGWRAMQEEEGASFGEPADRLRGPDEAPGAAPPPPPSSAPPSSPPPPPGGTP